MNVYDARALLLADSSAEARGLAAEALAGDAVADAILGDLLEEHMGEKVHPFVVGDKVMLFTLTLYFLGEVAEVGRGWVRLRDAHAIFVTADLEETLKAQDLAAEDSAGRRARSSRVGEMVVYLQSVVAHIPWSGGIPAAGVQ